MNHDITNEVLTEFSTAFSSNPVNRIAMNAVTSAGLLAASKNPMAQRESRHSYSISLEQGEITNQKQSGRCWMFAALNTFRFEVMKNLNLKTLSYLKTIRFSTTSWKNLTISLKAFLKHSMSQHRDVLSHSFYLLRLVMVDSGICYAILFANMVLFQRKLCLRRLPPLLRAK